MRARDVGTALRALWWSTVARAAIAVAGFGRAARALGLRPSETAPVGGVTPNLPADARRAVRVALRALAPRALRVTCLPRAIAVERVLRARGIEATLVLGAVHDEGFAAHAWVEVGGTPIGYAEPGDAAWRPLARFSRARRVGLADAAEAAEAAEA